MSEPSSAVRGLAELVTLVRSDAPRIVVPGLASGGAFAAAALARVADGLAAADRPLVVVTPDEARATQLASAIAFFLKATAPEGGHAPAETDVLHLPAIETSPYAEVSPDRRAIMRRLAALFRIAQGQAGPVLVASVPALLRRVIPRAALDGLCEVFLPASEMSRDAIAKICVRAGYTRSPVVEDPGTFALRGGVVDVWPPMYPVPARLELDGDLIESIRSFDPQTQRTLRELPELYVHPARETVPTPGADPRARLLEAADAAHHPSAKTRWILEQVSAGEDFFGVEALAPAFHAKLDPVDAYLPTRARYALIDPEGIWTTVLEELGDARERFVARRAEHRLALPPEDHFLATEEWRAMLGRARQTIALPAVELHDPERDAAPAIRLVAEPNRELVSAMARARGEKADSLLAPLVERLRRARDDGFRIALVAGSASGAERLRALLEPHGIAVEVRKARGAHGLWELGPGTVTCFLGSLRAGFELATDQLLVVTEEEIFGPRAPARPAAKQSAARAFGGDIDFANLKAGDHVVHAKNGIGRYQGMKKLPLASAPGVQVDFLHLEYEGGALYLPVYRLSEITPFVGADGANVKLDRLGGVSWEKTKRRVSAEVKKMAEELLQLYAQRKALPGFAFPPADEVFREFEATFPWEETPDQARAIDEVLADMEEARPMDRLVCGDVGYGKTEVALRATLKAALGGKQVAVLAPTTVLVEQHVNTFTERLKGWPVRVAGLSRFTSKAAQLEVVKKLAVGELDVVIGTHRLLSGDVRFKDLGLIVVDEEQRFGVAHKEKLKKLRTQVDTLVLTATPIPRTLHLGLLGLREISIISTPPVDRLAVRTLVARPDDDVIREGVKRELARGGQVFFVAHRIGGKPRGGKETEDLSLAEWADHLRALVPEARVIVGHGQMEPEALERVMTEFVAHQHDILVLTTIIESGLDIPRANTMFVARADMFGLAQLYQLRGRIGRSRERATCYLMVPPEAQMTDEAKQRLNVLQRFTELGAGFSIASHDLEIRGAGDFLGKEQSGQIAAVGFETYTAILEEAVAELRGEALHKARDPEMSVDLPAFIPDDYVPDTGQRLGLYKRLGEIDGEDGAAAILEEMHDRYGEVPDEAKLLAEVMIVKALARGILAVAVDLTADRLMLALDPQTPLKPEKILALVNKKSSPYRLTPDMRLARTFLEPEKKDRLQAARRALLELQACAN